MLRDAAPADAVFTLELRTNTQKNLHLSRTSPDIELQTRWLNAYADSTDQAYFVIESKDGNQLGTVRLYDPQGSSFCWGSWILKDGAPAQAAIESALMVYAYAIDSLGFHAAHFDVRQGNERVWRFHERFGAVRTSETENDFLYCIDAASIEKSRQRYHKYLPHPLIIET